MGSKVLLPILLAVASLTANTSAAQQRGITSTDKDRSAYLLLEKELWPRVDQLDKPTAALRAIFEAHYHFAKDHLPLRPDMSIDSDAFIALDAIYEWKQLEQYLHGVINLFEVFRLTLTEWSASPDEFNELALTDLVESILEDGSGSFKVAKTMDNIENIMVKQSLYYRAMLVG